jgi:hypothetical protein
VQKNHHIYGSTYHVGVPLEQQVIPKNLVRLQAELFSQFGRQRGNISN